MVSGGSLERVRGEIYQEPYNPQKPGGAQIANGAYDLEAGLARDPQWSREHLFSILFGVFSGLALLLALVGLFSVVFYSVAQSTMEFGIRLALGSSRSHIVWVAMRVAVLSLLIGPTVGGAADLVPRQNSDLPLNHANESVSSGPCFHRILL
ncbi:MAG: FtsX-like permease family protein [Silvibacterium sp.]